jgi:hypothetical protein
MSRRILEEQLRIWVENAARNGINQHDPKWYEAKVYTIGGSSLATIQGVNPMGNIYKLITDKIGITQFAGGIAPRWGNLFEDVIKRYVERDRRCTVYGEDLYIEGPPNTAYSPDGLAVMDVIDTYHINGGAEKGGETLTAPKISTVLLEFKCPYSRALSGSPPVYYIPQVKMGLDILKIADVGLLVEAVFRRCRWNNLDFTDAYDKALKQRCQGDTPLAIGIIGFYFDKTTLAAMTDEMKDALTALYEAYILEFVEAGDASNEFFCNDIGESSPDLFELIMEMFDRKILRVWYGSIAGRDTVDVAAAMNADMAAFTAFCTERNATNYGILPWKLFRVDYHFIQREPDYLARWLPKIDEIINLVRRCNDPANAAMKMIIYSEYVNMIANSGFSD